MSKIKKPNFTQIPNDLLGDIKRGNKVSPGIMANLNGSELKVLLAVCRITFGYHRDTRRASITMMQDFTGLSRPSVVAASKQLEELGYIEKTQDGGVTTWGIFVNEEPEVVKKFNQEEAESVKKLNQSGKKILLPSKKETKKEKNKERNIFGKDPLSDMVEGQANGKSKRTDKYQAEQWFEYSDKFIKLYADKRGYPNQDEKGLISDLAGEGSADLERWELALSECNIHWTGNSGRWPVTRAIEVYRAGGTWEKWIEKKFKSENDQVKIVTKGA